MDANGLNPVDVAVVVVVLLSALMAFARGFVRELLSVAAWVGATLATLWAFPTLSPVARTYISSGILADGAAILGCFTAALIVLSVLTHLISSIVQDSGLSAIDRSLGFAFGVVRGAVIVSLAFMFSQWVWPDTQPAWLLNARTRPLLATGAELLRGLMPAAGDPLQREAEKARREAQEKWQRDRDLERLSTPVPTAGIAKAGSKDQGYKTDDLGRLDQLLKTTDGAEPAPAAQPTPR